MGLQPDTHETEGRAWNTGPPLIALEIEMTDALVRPIETVVDGAATMGVASTTALAANEARVNAVFVNDSSEVIYLARGATAVLNEGIRLNANGGSYEIDASNLYVGIVTGIATGAAAELTVSEGV